MQLAYSEIERSRIYSSLFSRRVVTSILEENYGMLDDVIRCLDSQWLQHSHEHTYADYLNHAYSAMMENYRCEYVYKNEIINKILLRHFAHPHTVAFNELRANQSIADLAMFNGNSRGYEIKTDYDSDKRLVHQLTDYQKLFEKSYLVVSDDSVKRYLPILPDSVGVIVLEHKQRTLVHHIEREAVINPEIDIPTMMRSVRTQEYKNITKRVCGYLPDVSDFEIFQACEQMLMEANNACVNKAFISEIKKRSTNISFLSSTDLAFRQLCLCTNLSAIEYKLFVEKLATPIKN